MRRIKRRSLEGLSLTLIINYGLDIQEELTVPFANIVSLTHVRNMGNSGNTFSMTIQGPLTIDLEYKILSGNKKVLLQYGYTEESKRSFVGEIVSSEIKFESFSVAFNIKGTVSVMSSDQSKRTCVYKAGTRLRKIIELICADHGWNVGYIPISWPLKEDVTQNGISDTKFLKEVLADNVYTLEGFTDFKLWFTGSGKNITLNYSPIYKIPAENKKTYVYDMYGTTDTDLLSFSVKNQGELAYSVGASVRQAYVDDATGELKFASSDKVNKSLGALAESMNGLGRRDVFSNNYYGNIRVNKLDVQNSVDAYWLKMYELTYEAEAEVLGNVYLDAGMNITIIVLQGNGRAHYTSGQYLITEVTDEITSDGFISKLKLCRTMGTSAGNVVVN